MEFTRHLEAPDHFHFWSGVATLAGALRGKVWIDMGYWKWRPNFFIIFVAPPGIANKSTTIGVGQELLRQIEGIHFGPDSCTWQGITDAFLESTERVPMPNSSEDYTMSAITIAASELGTFLDPRNREMVDVLVDLWDGRAVPWKRRTKAEGASEIPNPWLNFVGATTPSWLQENFPEYAVKGGFTSRTVFLFSEAKRQHIAYPSQHILETDHQLKLKLLKDLKHIAEIAGEYTLSPSAYEWGEEWYKEHWENIPIHHDSDRLSGYLSRKQTHIHKVAMILSAADRDDRTISEVELQAALALLNAIEQDMFKVFTNLSDHPTVKFNNKVITTIGMYPRGILQRALWRQLIHVMPRREFEDAVTAGMNADLLIRVQEGNDFRLIHKTHTEEKKDAKSQT
jgi:hypothetical protein